MGDNTPDRACQEHFAYRDGRKSALDHYIPANVCFGSGAACQKAIARPAATACKAGNRNLTGSFCAWSGQSLDQKDDGVTDGERP